MTKKVYMHTLDGKPAEVYDGWICFADGRVTRFAKDLRQIRREQDICRAKRSEAFGGASNFEYGHCILWLPDQP